MTTALCFDLDGTLVQYTRSYEEIARETFEAHGIKDDSHLVAVYDEAFWDAFDALEPDPFERSMTAVVEEAETDADPAALVETLRDVEYAATTVPDGARASLEGLAADNHIGLVTNGVREWQVGKVDYHDLTDLFDAIVVSYDAGAHKPDQAPFDRLRETLPAEEYVMVGDDYEADVEGARAAGFVPIYYEDEGPDLWSTIEALL